MSVAALAERPAQPDVAAQHDPLPRVSRRGIGLCLSGGGLRASLFHLGALRRLNELGILARKDFRTITSVSGGSITTAALATALAKPGSGPHGPIPRRHGTARCATRCAPLRGRT